MALSLSAEQKDLLKIFDVQEQYVVPAFQRPYSWDYDQCFQMYNDLIKGHVADEDYFIGNIIIARNESDKKHLEIIDGQQRLTTILLMIKVLSVMEPDLTILNRIIEKKDWKGQNTLYRIKSDVFENDDDQILKNVLEFNKNDFENKLKQYLKSDRIIRYNRLDSLIEANILQFYSWFQYWSNKGNNLEKFIEYLLTKVYLLPIQLLGKTSQEASEKALVIFETINNRGLSLSDADIFKAKLYNKAKTIDLQDQFIESWVELQFSSKEINLEIDDIFRFYSHIVRGQNGVTSNEIKLREFFVDGKISPFKDLSVNEILEDLYNIINSLKFIQKVIGEGHEISRWLQILNAYSNQYPQFATVAYLFKNGKLADGKFLAYVKSLVRYYYRSGSTTSVKFETYNIIRDVFLDKEIDNYCYEEDSTIFNRLGRLRRGYALLGYYLNFDNKFVEEFTLDRLMSLRDFNPSDVDIQIENSLDTLGNYIVSDLSKKYIDRFSKQEYLNKSSLRYLNQIAQDGINLELIHDRDSKIKSRIIKFFSCEN